MAKFTYETPEFRVVLTEDDIKASNILDSSAGVDFNGGGGIGGGEDWEVGGEE